MEETPNKDEIIIQEEGISLSGEAGGKVPSVKKEILEWVFAILFAVVITLIIKFFIFDIVVLLTPRNFEITSKPYPAVIIDRPFLPWFPFFYFINLLQTYRHKLILV